MSRLDDGWRYVRPRIAPAGVWLLGAGLLVFLAVNSFSEEPLDPTETTLVIGLAVVLQTGAGVVLGRVGRVDRNHARSAVRTLLSSGRTLGQARGLLTEDENPVAADALVAVVARSIGDSIEDWNDVYGDALSDVLSEHKESQESLEL